MMERRVPNELVDCILDNLYFDKATLLNCTLVGRAWVRTSQRGIFREIILELPSYGMKNFDELVDAYLKTTRHLDMLFAEKPYLASYVRSLEIRSESYNAATPEVVYTATASLVQRLSNVNNLSFFRIVWQLLPPLLQEALTELCKAPSVTRFSAIHFNIPTFAELVSLLSRMRNLKVLGVDMLCNDWNMPNSLSELEIEEASHPPQSIQLDEMRVCNTPRFMKWLQQDSCPFGVRNLKSLEIRGLDMVNLQWFSIRELLGYTVTSALGLALALACFVNLFTLCLYRADTDSPVSWIQSLFKPLLISEGNVLPLQHLTISLNIMHSDPLDPRHWDPWSAIDTLLGMPEFAWLETVDFKLAPFPNWPEVPDGVRKLLSEKLPFLEGSGKLVVRITNE
ncbi:hypothetical protein BT96DRAFT_913787 [Gymnopus androsaceus JB14]|uniref:F-box domain-containing protein n=1 Tax=Gymnopus androsaceus JB14 TaxID=1447944 RepID=A0A6A4IDJ7_9AGAR|nr:hypothetical protein BT96DRAFT_913787 [Gymnopus androsaceus JB14]